MRMSKRTLGSCITRSMVCQEVSALSSSSSVSSPSSSFKKKSTNKPTKATKPEVTKITQRKAVCRS